MMGHGRTADRARHTGRRALIAVLSGAVLVAASVWVTTQFVSSPRQAQANADPPPPSLVSVAAESRVVGDEFVTRGTVTAQQRVNVITDAIPDGASAAVVSGHWPTVGAELAGGSVAVEVSGRPVIVLEGEIPAYRELAVGSVGGDVRQLQAALGKVGLGVGKDADGVFGEGTKAAMGKLYTQLGYPAPDKVAPNEIVFLSRLPAVVASAHGRPGVSAGQAAVWLICGDLVVEATIPKGMRQVAQPGDQVNLTSEVLQRTVAGTVADPAAQAAPAVDDTSSGEPTDGGVQPNEDTVTIVPTEPLDGAWVGQDVRVQVVKAHTAQPVLAVPIAAVMMDGSGLTDVVVVDPGATTLALANPRHVKVSTGLHGAGWVEVTPAQAGELKPGDAVAISGVQ